MIILNSIHGAVTAGAQTTANDLNAVSHLISNVFR